MDEISSDLINEMYEGRADILWSAVALLYGMPKNMLDANVFEVKQEMAAFRQALVGQYPYVAEWDDRMMVKVYRLYNEWYLTEKWRREAGAPFRTSQ